jgi:PKD repeat protein
MRVSIWFVSLFSLITVQGFAQSAAVSELKNIQLQRALLHDQKAKKIREFKNTRGLFIPEGLHIVDITPSGTPIYIAPLNGDAAITTGAASLHSKISGLDLQGEDITVGIWDDGFVKDHIEFDNRIISKEGYAPQNHATHVTGTILASGVNASARGMAPKAKATTWYFDNDESEMAALAKPDQTSLLFSNHSYGIVTGWYKVNSNWVWSGNRGISEQEDFRFGFYGDMAKILDQITYLAPYYTVVWAAGNDRAETGDGTIPADGNGGTGYDCIIPESVAKNIITVGAVNKVTSYTDASSVVMSKFSSAGPTDDGRIKPDFVAAGVNVFSTSAAGTNQYATLTGTSMSTPNATGSLVLVQELYSKLHSGRFMKASTVKGLAIHTVKEAGSYPGPDYQFGWGLLDVEAAAKVLLKEDDQNAFVKEATLNNNETYELEIQPQANQKITVTLCWTDPAGTPVGPSLDPADIMLVNDLDVRITDGIGNNIEPWTLDPANPGKKATTGDNFRDNVEKIEFSFPQTKKYFVRVSHKGQLLNGAQNFSLIVTCKSIFNSGTTYYWIGNNGNWSEGSHWSLTSGGAAANAIPSALDRVVFDENSFDGTVKRTVNFTSDAVCKKITWLTDKPAGFALNSNALRIKDNFTLSGKNFEVITKGSLKFEGTADHQVNLHTGNLLNASLVFSSGSWKVSGIVKAERVEVTGGDVNMSNLACYVSELNASSTAKLDVTASTFNKLVKSNIKETVNLISKDAIVDVSETTELAWHKIKFDGKVSVQSTGKIMMSGTNDINELDAAPGSTIELANESIQRFSNIAFNSQEKNFINVRSAGKATINLSKHQKLCFDYLSVKNVDVKNDLTINAGVNSVLLNAGNWLQQDCEQVIFADFDLDYTCANSMTTFTDMSLGNITSWSWNFGDAASADNTSTQSTSRHSFSKPGVYVVSLTVSDGTSVNVYKKEVTINDNGLTPNTIIVKNDALFSVQMADSYQWFRNNEPIAGAVSRSYEHNGMAGSYSVVTTGGICNMTSAPYVIEAVEKETKEMKLASAIQMYPNPARDFIRINLPEMEPAQVIIYDALGKALTQQSFTGSEMTIDLKDYNEGVYQIEIQASVVTRSKIVIRK